MTDLEKLAVGEGYAAVQVDQADADRKLLQDSRKTRLAVAELFFRAFALGDVADGAHEPHGAAVDENRLAITRSAPRRRLCQ
jgi:hypothetical protein